MFKGAVHWLSREGDPLTQGCADKEHVVKGNSGWLQGPMVLSLDSTAWDPQTRFSGQLGALVTPVLAVKNVWDSQEGQEIVR